MRGSLLLVLFMVTVCDLRAADSTWLEKHGVAIRWRQQVDQQMFDATGQKYTEKAGQHRGPIFVIDTVQFSGEFADLDLNERRGEVRRGVTPSKAVTIRVLGITSIADDTTKTPATYSCRILNDLKTLRIKSSNRIRQGSNDDHTFSTGTPTKN